MNFPFDYGFIPGTRCADGDRIDVLVLMDAPRVLDAEQGKGMGSTNETVA